MEKELKDARSMLDGNVLKDAEALAKEEEQQQKQAVKQ